MDTDDLTTGEKVTLVGGVLAVIGAFLPWVSAGFITVSGIDGDGVFTLIFGVIAGAIVLMRDWEKADVLGVGLLGVLTLLVAGNVFSSTGNQVNSAAIEFSVSAGTGLYLTLVAGLLLLAGAAYGYTNDESSPQEQTVSFE
jgi:hypothetical protein